jgi:uncharacterized tellurite resistance protein B-like protein
MGFYIRKSVRCGPLRFNLSKSGIGVSTGIPGFRIGIGPRGTYVHIGRGGLYYRKTLTLSNTATRAPQSQQQPYSPTSIAPAGTHGPMMAIGSGSIADMTDTNSADLLAEIEQKRRRFVWWPIVAVLSFILAMAILASGLPPWVFVPIILLLVVGILFVYQWDQLKKSVVLMYDLDETMLDSFQRLFESIEALSRCGTIWHVSGRGDVYDPRYHAGAGALLNRSRISIGFRSPPYVKTNVSVPCLPLGRITLYLLPDRMLAYAPNGVGAIDYSTLQLTAYPTRFIEEGHVPHDAKIVDHTWRFVNENGTPDRRFNNNRQIPICQYEELRIGSNTGVLEVMQLSRLGASIPVDQAIGNISKAISNAERAEVEHRRLQELERLDRELERQRLQAAPQSPPALPQESKPVKQKPTVQMLHQALFQSLCCIMVADGRASRTERVKIMDVMRKMKSGWTEVHCDTQIDGFIERLKQDGYSKVLSESLACLTMFRNSGHEATVIKCIEAVAIADGKVDQRERELILKIAELLGVTSINLPH